MFVFNQFDISTKANGVSSTISAAEKWRTLDKNNDKKLDETELSLFLGTLFGIFHF